MFARTLLLLALALPAYAGTDWDAALTLVRAKHFAEARPLLEKITAAEPGNAAAWHELGTVWLARHDTMGCEQAVRCFKQASDLQPKNARFLGDYGGASLELASRSRSLSAATSGRDAMEHALQLDPANLDVREGLYQYYLRAPFFIGGSAKKAAAQLDEIRRRDPGRAVALAVLEHADRKDFDGAFSLCDAELVRDPDNYTVLYQYGRTAGISGKNLERGLACLKHALTLTPPSPAAPTYSHIWFRIGVIDQKLGQPAEARAAFRSSLEQDPENRAAKVALERLK